MRLFRRRELPVHPHVCGEYDLLIFLTVNSRGSPPRVWGIPRAGPPGPAGSRFTPTCVGNTPPLCVLSGQTAVHPHVCGEYGEDDRPILAQSGSPPRVWGIRLRTTAPSPTESVHPHVCGEYAEVALQLPLLAGSPPRVWGIRDGFPFWLLGRRFTPTCVGNTSRNLLRPAAAAVHPHVCGEYICAVSPLPCLLGSPPRVWGILDPQKLPASPHRFTPTCVGNTSRSLSRTRTISVHPHVCGEYLIRGNNGHMGIGSPPRVWGIRASRFKSLRETGSPPRVWGIRSDRLTFHGNLRFTPTCVGNTYLPSVRARLLAVHPHVCGEYLIEAASEASTYGSPPRVWGILSHQLVSTASCRFTPTCVGNTLR